MSYVSGCFAFRCAPCIPHWDRVVLPASYPSRAVVVARASGRDDGPSRDPRFRVDWTARGEPACRLKHDPTRGGASNPSPPLRRQMKPPSLAPAYAFFFPLLAEIAQSHG